MKNDKKALDSIGIALGLRGPSQKQCEKAAKRFTGRQRGKPIDLDVRKNIAKRLLMGRAGDTYRSIAIEFGVSLGSITNIKKRIVDVEPSDDNAPSMDAIVDSLRNRKRCGGAATKRKIGNDDAHAAFVRELLEKHDARLQLSELCTLFERQFEVRVSTSTMQRFVHRQLGFSRQRVQRQLPRQALTEKNIKWRKEFIGEWFVGADEQLIGTNDEQNDQKNWQLRTDGKRDLALAEQVFWVDETGCNRHTLLRTHGLARRGNGGVRAAGRFDGQKGRNHSVLIAIGAAGGIVARKVLVGSNEKRGTRRDDFCTFLRTQVVPAMLASANAAGVDRRAPLYLMMDNASIHRGAVVSHALRSVSKRLHVAYQPPYMPTVNPVELVNNHLKTALRSMSLGDTVSRLLIEIDKNKKNKNKNKKNKKNGSLLIDPLGGVVRNQAPIDEEPLDKLIEQVLDSVEQETVAKFVAHCGWR